jgi:hypothetical protein
MGLRNRLPSNTDAGREAVRAALLSLHARPALGGLAATPVTVVKVARALGPRVTAAQVVTVAQANTSDMTLTSANTLLELTSAGYQTAKHHPQPGQLAPA